jgi:plastocyanin
MAHTRLRRAWSMLLGIGLLMGLLLAPSAASASGGGGCGRRVTDATGTTVTIRQYCFGPTILRVAPGETVTWINKDAAPHTVVGANAVWGDFSTLRRTARVTYRFIRPGVYPYVCTYHPGMVGAVVVGDGTGLGSAGSTTTADGPVTRVDPSTEPRTIPLDVAQPIQTHAASAPWAAGVGAALVLSLIAGVAWVRSRRHRVASAAP